MGKLRANSEIISDKSKNPVTTSTYIKHGNQWLDDAVNNVIGAAASKADKTYVDSELAKKANKSDTDAALSSKADKSELSTKADKSAREATNASLSANTSNIQELSTESTVLSARMDEFTKLEEGSTTGDAELADGRVGADGKTYDNIGGAIRGQVTDLKSEINEEIITILEFNGLGKNNVVKTEGEWTNTNIRPFYAGENTTLLESNNRITLSRRINVIKNNCVTFKTKSNIKYRVVFFENDGALTTTDSYPTVDAGIDDARVWHTEERTINIPIGAVGLSVSLAFIDDSAIDVSLGQSCIDIILENNESSIQRDIFNAGNNIYTKIINTNWFNGFVSASINDEEIKLNVSKTRCFTDTFDINGWDTVYIDVPDGWKCRISYVDFNGKIMMSTYHKSWHTGSRCESIPTKARTVTFSVAHTDDSEISPSDCYEIKIKLGYYCGKIISILGDSISTYEGYSYEGNRCRYPQSDLLTDVNDTYWMRIIKMFDMKLGINEAWAGSRVSWDGNTESSDIGANKHIASEARIGHLGENGTPDIILVNAGTNDIGNKVTLGTFNYENPMNYTNEQISNLPVDTFADAYRTMLIRLQKSYPYSTILVLLPNYTTSYYTPQEADQYCEIIKEACDYFGVRWYDMRACGVTIFNRTNYIADGIHYNAAGMEMIAKRLVKELKYDFTVGKLISI